MGIEDTNDWANWNEGGIHRDEEQDHRTGGRHRRPGDLDGFAGHGTGRPRACCARAARAKAGRVGYLRDPGGPPAAAGRRRSEEHTSELQSLMRISYAVCCLKKKKMQ